MKDLASFQKYLNILLRSHLHTFIIWQIVQYWDTEDSSGIRTKQWSSFAAACLKALFDCYYGVTSSYFQIAPRDSSLS